MTERDAAGHQQGHQSVTGTVGEVITALQPPQQKV